MHRFAFAAIAGLGPAASRWSSVACTLVLTACAGSPHAAVSQPAAGPTPAAQIGTCQAAPGARTALQRVADELSVQGLRLQASCAPAGAGWVVQVHVVDGLKASKIVRGPLADGHVVDMGTPAGVKRPGAEPAAQGFSPDVQFNRQWLQATMARHQFDNAQDAWWHYAQRGDGTAHPHETDLAAR